MTRLLLAALLGVCLSMVMSPVVSAQPKWFAVCQCKGDLVKGYEPRFNRPDLMGERFGGYISMPLYETAEICVRGHESFCRGYCARQSLRIGLHVQPLEEWKFMRELRAAAFSERYSAIKISSSLQCLPEDELRYCPPIPDAFSYLDPKPTWISVMFYQPIPTLLVEGPLQKTDPIQEKAEEVLRVTQGLISHPDTPKWALAATITVAGLYLASRPVDFEQAGGTVAAVALLLLIADQAGAQVFIPKELAPEVERLRHQISVVREEKGTTYQIQILDDPFELFLGKDEIHIQGVAEEIKFFCTPKSGEEQTTICRESRE